MGKKSVVQRIPKDSILKQLGISKTSVSALTRRMAEPVEIHDQVEPHHAVLKMQSSFYVTKDNNRKKDQRLEKTLSRLNNLAPGADDKLAELMKSKEKYQNKVKMEHELELERLRRENARRRRISLHDQHQMDETIAARDAYEANVASVKVNTGKETKVKKDVKKDQGLQLASEIKKLRFSMTHPKKTSADMSKAQFGDAASQFFAKKLGWIENDTPGRLEAMQMTSPLASYNETNNVEEAKIDQDDQRDFVIMNDNETHEIDLMEFREMDLEEIKRLERKYKKQADDIRRQLERQNHKVDRSGEMIANTYGKIVDSSPVTKLKDKKQIEELSKDVDVSKIPSFVLESMEKKESKKK